MPADRAALAHLPPADRLLNLADGAQPGEWRSFPCDDVVAVSLPHIPVMLGILKDGELLTMQPMVDALESAGMRLVPIEEVAGHA